MHSLGWKVPKVQTQIGILLGNVKLKPFRFDRDSLLGGPLEDEDNFLKTVGYNQALRACMGMSSPQVKSSRDLEKISIPDPELTINSC